MTPSNSPYAGSGDSDSPDRKDADEQGFLSDSVFSVTDSFWSIPDIGRLPSALAGRRGVDLGLRVAFTHLGWNEVMKRPRGGARHTVALLSDLVHRRRAGTTTGVPS